MASASILSSPFSTDSRYSFRINQVCPSTHLHQLQSQKCYIKLYMVPSRVLSGHCIGRFCPSGGFLEVNGKIRVKQFNPSITCPSDVPRRKRICDATANVQSSVKEFEQQLQGLFQEVKIMIDTGKEDEARALLQANYEAVKEQLDAGAKGIEEAGLLDVLALGYMALGDVGSVESLLRMLNEVVNHLNDDEPLLDSILVHMGSMQAQFEKFDTSINSYKRALEIMEREYGNDGISLITPLLGMAKVLGSSGRATKAIEIYHRVMTILESSRGAESEDLVVPLAALGNLLMKEKKVADAEISFRRILEIYVKLYGESDGRTGMALCSLAHVNCAKGDADEAIDLYKKALGVLKESQYVALDDRVMEKMRIDLAELLHAVGRVEEGRTLLKECLLITEQCRGKEHPSSVPHLINLAVSYSRCKNYAEAERLLRSSLQIMAKTVPHDDQSISFPMLHLAITLYNLGRDEEAEKLALEVLHIREKAFGRESLLVGEALDCLVSIQTRLEKSDRELLELLKRVLKIQEKAFGYDSEEIIGTLKKIVHYLDKLGMKHEKLPLQRRLSSLRNNYNQTVYW